MLLNETPDAIMDDDKQPAQPATGFQIDEATYYRQMAGMNNQIAALRGSVAQLQARLAEQAERLAAMEQAAAAEAAKVLTLPETANGTHEPVEDV